MNQSSFVAKFISISTIDEKWEKLQSEVYQDAAVDAVDLDTDADADADDALGFKQNLLLILIILMVDSIKCDTKLM